MNNKELKILLIILLASQTIAVPLNPKNIIAAINCGTKDQQVQSVDKIFKYKPDDSFVSGKSVDVDYHTNEQAKENDIKYTFEKRLYMFERHTYDEMIYNLPVKQGKITLILKFAQMYFDNAGQRVFNIKIGKKIIRQNFDVVQLAGSKYAAHEEYIEIQVTKDGVYYQGIKIDGALVSGKLKLSFVKGKADNPIVQGIIVYHSSIENSPKQEYSNLKKKWDSQKQVQKAIKQQAALKQLIAIQKKKEKIVIRNDQLIVQRQEIATENTQIRQKYGFVRKLLMSYLGIIGFSFAFAFAGIFMYNVVFLMNKNSKQASSK